LKAKKILGFGNRWYKQAFEYMVQYSIGEHIKVNILPAPWFIATKLEAFQARGGNDGRTSEDFEDIVFILQNRSGIWLDLRDAQEQLKQYLQQEFLKLLSNKYIEEWIAAHSSSSVAQTILFEMAAFAEE
jgi:hypothetical protein